MATGNSKATGPYDWDVRVRERNLRRGVLDEKRVDAYLQQLVDVADRAEPIAFPQPALGGRHD